MFFQIVCSEGGQDLQGQKVPECLKALVFLGIRCLSEKVFTPVAGRGEESDKHRLENTVWNP